LVVAARQRNFCSWDGTPHFDLRQARRALSVANRPSRFLVPGEPQCADAFGFFNGFHMLVARLLTPSLLLLAGSALAGTPPYDGVWDVTVETRTGSCEPSAQYRLTVQDGKISGPANIAGTVAHEGMVKVSINGVYAFGQLVGRIGSGKWNAAATGKPCSGRWQATKE
jgi:hypothetical protein